MPRPSYSDIVTVLVEPNKARFTVHEDIICSRSGFFEAACARGRNHSQENLVRLPDILGGGYFQVYLDRLYNSSSDVNGRASELAAALPEDVKEGLRDVGGVNTLKIAVLCDLWQAGDFLEDHAFRNAVMDALVLHSSTVPLADWFVKAVVLGSKRASGLQKWLVDVLSPKLSVKLLDALEGQVASGFLMELLRAQVSRRTIGTDSAYTERCKYHEYPDGETRCT